MVASYVTDLQKAVSSSRLESYRPIGGSDLDMAVNYFWNLALAEALVPTLATLEVALRNSIHNALTKREGTDMWFRNVLEPNQLRDYANAHITLYRRQKRMPVAGQIVAELNFGFWTALLSQLYHQTIWVPDRAAMIRMVFPFLPSMPNSRRYIHDRCNPLRALRNRVMHHEPILKGLNWNGQLYRVNDLHENILEAIGWINPVLLDSVKPYDRFSAVYADGRQQAEINIRRHLGT